ncbi:hypothetical protein AGOR_G00135230 [Albula goreensis]|uniref:Uncharacterized protein n=1 Tax=Albula goreensis TaxID=1534307 RepID=A0A8T3DCH2_9TELE|nr:hypothetical protein AGOR_G00135230 [Albula goreensis]
MADFPAPVCSFPAHGEVSLEESTRREQGAWLDSFILAAVWLLINLALEYSAFCSSFQFEEGYRTRRAPPGYLSHTITGCCCRSRTGVLQHLAWV